LGLAIQGEFQCFQTAELFLACKKDFPPAKLDILLAFVAKVACSESSTMEGFNDMDHDGDDPEAYIPDPNAD
jgi:hypothetical protein